jgi:hypothetical protein
VGLVPTVPVMSLEVSRAERRGVAPAQSEWVCYIGAPLAEDSVHSCVDDLEHLG